MTDNVAQDLTNKGIINTRQGKIAPSAPTVLVTTEPKDNVIRNAKSSARQRREKAEKELADFDSNISPSVPTSSVVDPSNKHSSIGRDNHYSAIRTKPSVDISSGLTSPPAIRAPAVGGIDPSGMIGSKVVEGFSDGVDVTSSQFLETLDKKLSAMKVQ